MDGPSPAADFSAYAHVRRERADQALICLFAGVLNKPLAYRELTPEERARRENRIRERQRVRGLITG